MTRVVVTPPPRIVVEDAKPDDGEPHLQGSAQEALKVEVERAVAATSELGKNVLLRLRRLTPGEDVGNDLLASARRYQGMLRDLLTEERERAKLRLLLEKNGSHAVLSDEEYAAELKQLGIEAVRELSTEELAAEVQRRGISLGHDDDRDDDS